MTPRAITAPELVKLRSSGQWSNIGLIVDAPDTIYTARATGAVSSTYSLGFDGGSGTLGNCLTDMTLLIGSTSGGFDIGEARLRKAPIAGTFYIGADPSLEVADNDYLTVINDFSIFAKHPVGLLADVDITYSDEFEDFIPNCVVDGGRIAVINAAETAYFDASASWVIGSAISAYAWTFTGATSTTDTDTATPTATYNTSGRYRWSLVLTAANAKTATFYGWVYVLGDNLALEYDFAFDTIECREDGAQTRIVMYDRPTIKDNARIVIVADDYYDNEFDCLGPVTGRENIVMVGWILGETIKRDPQKELVEFEVAGPLAVLSNITSMQVGLVDKSLPNDTGTKIPKWSKMTSLTAAKGLHHLANYRSNLATVCDFYVEDWGYASHNLASSGDNLLSQIDDFAANAALTVRADRYGVIYIQRDGQLYPVADRTANIPAVMTMTDADWQDELPIIRRNASGVGLAEVEGNVFKLTKLKQVGGRSPGDEPARWGPTESISDLNVSAKADVLELAGLLAGSMNTEIERVVPALASINRFIDVAPRQFVSVVVDGDTLRCYPRWVSFRQVNDSGSWTTEIELEPEGDEWPSVSILYPGDGSNPIEPTPPPPPPGWVEPPEPPPLSGDVAAAIACTSAPDVRTTDDISVANPTWTTEF